MADTGRSETLPDERADDADATDGAATDTSADTAAGASSDTAGQADGAPDETPVDETPVDEEPADEEPAAPAAATGTDDTLDTDDDLDDEDLLDEDEQPERPWALIAATAVAVLAVVALAVTAFLAPGWAIYPGSPDSVAEQATTALAAKDPMQLDAVSCRNQQGTPTNPFPPDALALIQQAVPAGPAELQLDTQARAPIDLTLSAQGQVQNLPADIVLGVTDGQWCMTGISQRG